MKKIFLTILFTPIIVFATEGACSSHGGVNCGIGAVNGMAVCFDRKISGVYYHDMIECETFSDQCKTYLTEPMYSSNRDAILTQMSPLATEIKKLKQDIEFNLYHERETEKEELLNRNRSQPVTRAAMQPRLNAIDREYAKKELDARNRYYEALDEYDILLIKYNGICKAYNYDYKDSICKLNYGENSKYIGTKKSCYQTTTKPVAASTTVVTYKTKSPDELCALEKHNDLAWFNAEKGECVACKNGYKRIPNTNACVPKDYEVPEQTAQEPVIQTVTAPEPIQKPIAKAAKQKETQPVAEIAQEQLEDEQEEKQDVMDIKSTTTISQIQKQEHPEPKTQKQPIIRSVVTWVTNFWGNLFK